MCVQQYVKRIVKLCVQQYVMMDFFAWARHSRLVQPPACFVLFVFVQFGRSTHESSAEIGIEQSPRATLIPPPRNHPRCGTGLMTSSQHGPSQALHFPYAEETGPRQKERPAPRHRKGRMKQGRICMTFDSLLNREHAACSLAPMGVCAVNISPAAQECRASRLGARQSSQKSFRCC